MAQLAAAFEAFLSKAAGHMWGPWMLILLFGTHLFLTMRLRGIQRYTPRAIRLSFQRSREGHGDISHFGALMTALAATVGTGNIVGVATAVAGGGPGAVLWMWLTGVFGISTKYAEAVLAVKYRVTRPDGQIAGGPMYALERGLGLRWLGILFAVFTAVAAFGIGNMVQANSLTDLVEQSVKAPAWLAPLAARLPAGWVMGPGGGISAFITGLVITAITAVVILGGIRSIAKVCGLLVPFMAVFYVLGCVSLLVLHADTLPATVSLILRSAWSGHAAVGGFLGAGMKEAIRFGVARGLFSNESGLGSAPIVAAAAQTRNPVRQALVSSTGTFWDTVVICLITGLVIVNSGDWETGLKGAALTKSAFMHLGGIGPLILTVGMVTFVFSTILGWSYYGEKAAEYLFGPVIIWPYRVMWVAAAMIGSVVKLQAVWDFADIANAAMAIPNLVCLLLLSGVVVAETRTYLWLGSLDQDDRQGIDAGGAFPTLGGDAPPRKAE